MSEGKRLEEKREREREAVKGKRETVVMKIDTDRGRINLGKPTDAWKLINAKSPFDYTLDIG